jgi:hypothetical protein
MGLAHDAEVVVQVAMGQNGLVGAGVGLLPPCMCLQHQKTQSTARLPLQWPTLRVTPCSHSHCPA